MAKPIKKKTINTAKTQITTISTVLRKVLKKKIGKKCTSSIKNLAFGLGKEFVIYLLEYYQVYQIYHTSEIIPLNIITYSIFFTWENEH